MPCQTGTELAEIHRILPYEGVFLFGEGVLSRNRPVVESCCVRGHVVGFEAGLVAGVGLVEAAGEMVDRGAGAFVFVTSLAAVASSGNSLAYEATKSAQLGVTASQPGLLDAWLDWDGDDLMFVTRIVRGTDEATNSVRYRLEEDGAVLVGEESFRSAAHAYDNRWVIQGSLGLYDESRNSVFLEGISPLLALWVGHDVWGPLLDIEGDTHHV